MAWRPEAGRGRHVEAWFGRQGAVGLGTAGRGAARRVTAGPGQAGHGRFGLKGRIVRVAPLQPGKSRRGRAGMVWPGRAGPGAVGLGKAGPG